MVKVDKVEKDVKEILGMKKSPLKFNFVEEEILVDVRFVSGTGGLKMIDDSCALLSVVSEKWMRKYINEKVVDENELEYRNCVRRFRFGENVYLSTKEVKFPIVVEVEDGYIGLYSYQEQLQCNYTSPVCLTQGIFTLVKYNIRVNVIQ